MGVMMLEQGLEMKESRLEGKIGETVRFPAHSLHGGFGSMGFSNCLPT